MYRQRVPSTKRIALWPTECKKRPVPQLARTNEMGKPGLQ